MNIPQTVMVGSIRWRIIMADVEAIATKYGLEADHAGVCVPHLQTIYIDEKQARGFQLLTFWHEIVHAIWRSHDLPRRKLTEEKVATLFGPSLYDFLAQNATIRWHHPTLQPPVEHDGD